MTRFDRRRTDGESWTVNPALSVVLHDLPEQRRGPPPAADPAADPAELHFVGVDGGVVASVDWTAYDLLCKQDEELLEEFFLTEMAACPTPWDRLLSGRTENVVADQSGYGDGGGYPVYASFAADGRLAAMHGDFQNRADLDRYQE